MTASAALLVLVSPVAADDDCKPKDVDTALCDDDDRDDRSGGARAKPNPKPKAKDPKDPPTPVDPPISVASTPELGSLLLFGTGLAGAGAYALTRLRARRRSDSD